MGKRILILLMLLAALSLGAQEKITFLHQGDVPYEQIPSWKDTGGYKTSFAKLIYQFEQANPGVKVQPMMMDLSAGSTLTLDALLAAGTPPDVVIDAAGKVAKLLNPTYAIEVSKYVDTSDYTESGLEPCYKDGKLLALPIGLTLSTPAVNTDNLAAVGYTLPAVKDWTTVEFLKLAMKLKASGKYATVLFAKNQSSDHWWLNWFMAFGAKLFPGGGDYSHTVLNSPQAASALAYLKQLVSQGYVPPNPGELDDDMALDMWARGNVTMLSMQIGHTFVMKSYVDQKIIPKEFGVQFTEFPHAPGLSHTPAVAGPTLVVGHKSGNTKRDAMIAKFIAEVVTGYEQQWITQAGGNFATRKSVNRDLKYPNPNWEIQQKIVAEAGLWDRGGTLTQFPEIRAVMPPLLQAFYAGKMSAEDVLKNYESAVNKILKQ